jgi:hypothetical protein
MLQSALEILVGAEVSIGQVYYDYTPANLLFEKRSVVLGRSARCVTARRAALGFFVFPQLYATPFMEVQLAATVRLTACDDHGSPGCLPTELSCGFRQAVS